MEMDAACVCVCVGVGILCIRWIIIRIHPDRIERRRSRNGIGAVHLNEHAFTVTDMSVRCLSGDVPVCRLINIRQLYAYEDGESVQAYVWTEHLVCVVSHSSSAMLNGSIYSVCLLFVCCVVRCACFVRTA